MARSKTNYGQDWVTKHLPQLKRQWAEREAEELALAIEYEADGVRMDEALEKARQEEYRRKVWLGAYGPVQTLPVVQTTARPEGGDCNNAEPNTSGSHSKPRIRNRTLAPPVPPENGWGERLRRTRTGKQDDGEDEDEQTDNEDTIDDTSEDTSDDGEGSGQTEIYQADDSGENSDSYNGPNAESLAVVLGLILSNDNRGTEREISSKRKHDNESVIDDTSESGDGNGGGAPAAKKAKLVKGVTGHVCENEIENAIGNNDLNEENIPNAKARKRKRGDDG
ncbi:MAG: hypothetical protein M1839_000355 [Geoglossum umbratile]|nr:MAG: hypothetical protein M1839_000355 [Geoglossum umbratile]